MVIIESIEVIKKWRDVPNTKGIYEIVKKWYNISDDVFSSIVVSHDLDSCIEMLEELPKK